jgi:hypothetical protein
VTNATQTTKTLISLPISTHWNTLVPEYQSRVYSGLILKLQWNHEYAELIGMISAKRRDNRIANYIDFLEIDRAHKKLETKGEASIRFGVKKTGHGYSGERGDFCLVGGVVRGRDLTVFYRSLELIGGFAYDLCVFRYLETALGIGWKNITIMATKANVFALKGNSNEKLYPKLQKIFKQ